MGGPEQHWTYEELRSKYPGVAERDLRHALVVLNSSDPKVGPDGLTPSQRSLNEYARRLGLRLPFRPRAEIHER